MSGHNDRGLSWNPQTTRLPPRILFDCPEVLETATEAGMEAALDFFGHDWQRLYAFGDEFASRGMSIASHIASVQDADDHDHLSERDYELLRLVRLARKERTNQRRKLDEMRTKFPNPDDSARRALLIQDYQFRVASLRVRADLIGDRRAIEREAKHSGLAGELHELIEEIEAQVSELTEESDELQPRLVEARRDFGFRLERGEIVQDPLYGWTEAEHLRSVGARTRVTDISTPVPSADEVKGEACPICLEQFATADQAVRLPCSHLVDATCLDIWINSLAEKCNTCVLCRSELFRRRRREPSGYTARFQELTTRYENLTDVIRLLRCDSEHLVILLQEIQPERVAHSLGR